MDVLELKDILNEHIELLRQCVEIYHNQTTVIFDNDLYKTFGDVDKLTNKDDYTEEEYKQIGTDRMRLWMGSCEIIKRKPIFGLTSHF